MFKKLGTGMIIAILSLILISCEGNKNKDANNTDLKESSWESILSDSKGKKVNIYMWGGSESTNKYMDLWVKPQVKDKFDIDLNRVPINDAKDMTNKLMTEKDVNKNSGTMDICWLNGENFKMVKDNSLLLGSFVDKLPNYNKYVDKDAKDINTDFGEDTEGLEAPFGKAQFVFIYDTEKVKNPPKSMEEFKLWVKENPGKFTYPAPPDFTGSAFVRQTLLETSGGYEAFSSKVNEEKFSKDSESLWNYLNEIKPYLWREGKTYPESASKLDQLYSNGEIWITMSYNPIHAANKIKEGVFSKSTRSFVLDKGTLSNTHYLTIPFNAPNKDAAMVVIDFMISKEAQFKKMSPDIWGDGTIISSDKLSEEEKKELNDIDRGQGTLSSEELEKHRVSEISSSYVDIIEKYWMENVAKN
ncbi:ABC transporter substrate-binding protein [Clostridium algidicarnis]|uniref:ABC transporter substrate-binding protein n=1 Tax=Clostridium algidicarnis TaxID=37659 RepID=UPI001C0CBD4B|nr:ABC transporter substrate-binding protein [Clostridium algidicarnis]MBU3208745.1 ABC transporter substrate-binding protein [Clostridium algidicarnis]